MKKTLRIIALAAALLLCLSSIVACSKKKNGENGSTEKKLENATEVGTYKDPEYLAPIETEEETEKKTEKETEAVTEKKPDPTPEKSLKFTSFGNGTCSVSGIGTCEDSCVVIPERSPDGDIVTSIDEKAFFGNTDIKAFQIPSTLTSIGNMAFGGCTSLVYISVDKANKAFCDVDGILYSADKSTLIHYPASCGASSLTLSAKVRRISDMAFYDCDTLKTIYYGGTLQDWGKIDIGDMNYGLYTASISCADSGK